MHVRKQVGAVLWTAIVCGLFLLGLLSVHRSLRGELSDPPETHRLPAPVARFEPTREPEEPLPPSVAFEPSAPASGALASAVQRIAAQPHSAWEYNDYRDALRQLTPALSADDIEALIAFIRLKPADCPELRPIEFNAVKNDVVEVLLRQDVLPVHVGDVLVQMYRDRDYEPMWRDYCLQFLTPYYERRWPTQMGSTDPVPGESPENEALRRSFESVYWEALAEIDSTIAGTALLGLRSLSVHDERIDRRRIATEAIILLHNDQVSEPVRITAISLAASLGAAEALPRVRILAQIGETVAVRMAAVAALGELGVPEDLELLVSLANDDVPQLQRIAGRAAETLRKRQTEEGS